MTAIDGRILVLAGPENVSLDLYLIEDSSPAVRLTHSDPKLGISSFDANRSGTVVMAEAPEAVDQIVVRRLLKGRLAGRKRRLGVGSSPAISDRGSIAYLRVRARSELRLARPGRRTRTLRISPGRPDSSAFGRGESLYVNVRHRKKVRLRRLSSTGARRGRDWFPAAERYPGRILVSHTGRVAYRGNGGFTIWSARGRKQVFNREPWLSVLTWSLDGRRLLAQADDGRLLTIDPRSGAATDLGVNFDQVIYFARWIP